MRRAARIDSNQNEIVKHARSIGFSVAVTSRLGDDFPDLVVGYGGLSVLAEVKDGEKPPSARKLSDGQKRFADTWTGGVYLIEKTADLDRLMQTMDSWRKAIWNSPLDAYEQTEKTSRFSEVSK